MPDVPVGTGTGDRGAGALNVTQVGGGGTRNWPRKASGLEGVTGHGSEQLSPFSVNMEPPADDSGHTL